MEKQSQQFTNKGEKTICLPISNEDEYEVIINNLNKFRDYLQQTIQQFPELFPPEIEQGFSFFGSKISKKQNLRIRLIILKANHQIYQLRPSFVMPYMVGKTKDLDKPLYLRRYGVPFDGLTYVFGKNDMYWYRAFLAMGRFSLVGTTIKNKEQMPLHLDRRRKTY